MFQAQAPRHVAQIPVSLTARTSLSLQACLAHHLPCPCLNGRDILVRLLRQSLAARTTLTVSTSVKRKRGFLWLRLLSVGRALSVLGCGSEDVDEVRVREKDGRERRKGKEENANVDASERRRRRRGASPLVSCSVSLVQR